MSFITSQLSFLTLRPSIRETADEVVIGTGFVTGLCTLFLNTRRVVVRPVERTVGVSCRRAYFFTSHVTFDFDDVWYIDYGFDSMGTDWGVTSSGFGRHDQMESFTISIVTRNEKSHSVCAFRGEGSACTGWGGVLLGGDNVFDFAGTQDRESRKFAQYLAELLGVTIGKPLQDVVEMVACPGCGHLTSPHVPRCLYCGAAVSTA